MNSAIICFTAAGVQTALRIRESLAGRESGSRIRIWCKKKDYFAEDCVQILDGSLREWTGARFADSDAVIFVGATGIAVRSIAPFLVSKTKDPAVIAVDEQGKFVISLVSGHIGGANELCTGIAADLQSIPVITTATDLNGKFAVDVFAGKNHLWISNMKIAKEISAALLDGEQVAFVSDFPVDGKLPLELVTDRKDRHQEIRYEIRVTVRKPSGADEAETGRKILSLVPKAAVLGIGCRRGKEAGVLEAFVTEVLEAHGIWPQAIARVCSIDVKADEPGLLQLCRERALPFVTYSAEELMRVPGVFGSSAFVAGQVGVDNVCERSAVRGSENGTLLIGKTARDGMTAALALKKGMIHFE